MKVKTILFYYYVFISSSRRHFSYSFYISVELHLPVKTTTTSLPPRHNIDVMKPAKNPPHHTKNKSTKGKYRKGDRKHHEFEDEERDRIFEVTTSFWVDPHTVMQRTTHSSTIKPPPWVVLQNSAFVLHSRLVQVCLPFWVTIVYLHGCL